eukprot:568389-Pyramimonas_sp.AAC.1
MLDGHTLKVRTGQQLQFEDIDFWMDISFFAQLFRDYAGTSKVAYCALAVEAKYYCDSWQYHLLSAPHYKQHVEGAVDDPVLIYPVIRSKPKKSAMEKLMMAGAKALDPPNIS